MIVLYSNQTYENGELWRQTMAAEIMTKKDGIDDDNAASGSGSGDIIFWSNNDDLVS